MFKGKGGKKKKGKFPVEEAIFNPENEHLPPLFTKCCAYLEEKALDLEGIFRVSGSVARVKALKERFDRGEDVNIFEILEPHCVSGCLKLFLRELSDPVCTFELYDCFLAGGSVPLRSNRISCLRKVIELLPPGNYALLKAFVHLLKLIHDQREVNMMKASNLSIVFSPTLLRAKSENHESMMTDMNQTNSLVELIIIDYDEIFEGKDVEDEMREEGGANDNTTSQPPATFDLPPPSGTTPTTTTTTTTVDTTGGTQTLQSSSEMAVQQHPQLVEPPRQEALFYVRGLWDFEAELFDEISFSAGMILGVLQREGDKEGFWFGEYYVDAKNTESSPVPTILLNNRRWGWFQSDYAEEIEFDASQVEGAQEYQEKTQNEQDETTQESSQSLSPELSQQSQREQPSPSELTEQPPPPEQPSSSPVQQLPQPVLPQQPTIPPPNLLTLSASQPTTASRHSASLSPTSIPPSEKTIPRNMSHIPQSLPPSLPSASSTPSDSQQQQQQQLRNSSPLARNATQPLGGESSIPSQRSSGEGATRLVCRAKWDFKPPPEKQNVLSFKRGEVIVVWKKGKEGGWWTGKLNGKYGHFPVSYTEVFNVPLKKKDGEAGSSGSESPSPRGAASLAKGIAVAKVGASPRGSGKAANPEFEKMLKLAKQNRASQMIQPGAYQKQFGQFQQDEKNGVEVQQKMVASRLSGESTAETKKEEEVQQKEETKKEETKIEEPKKEETKKEGTKEEGSNKEKGDWVLAMFSFTKTPDTPELSFNEGDQMRVLRRFPGGWMEVLLGDNKGFIPGTYVEPCDPP